MHMSELEYDLPPELIAATPVEPRDQSRLMVVDRTTGEIQHRHFTDIAEFLRPHDLLVVNNTRVLPAKLSLKRKSGGLITGLFVAQRGPGMWDVLLRTRGKVREGEELIGAPYSFLLERRQGEGLWRVRVTPGDDAPTALAQIGHVPLPPYIEKQRRLAGAAAAQGDQQADASAADRRWYQTVYAQGIGRSVAAPTAGLHFTPELLTRLEAAGVRRAAVALDVGLGTFLPVETETLDAHPMHTERYHVPAETIAAIHETRAMKSDGRKIVVVGTTAVRTLETAAPTILESPAAVHAPTGISGDTNLKIAPGFPFRLTDSLITNFHLPRSTLMALVGAFLGNDGVDRLKTVYALAVREKYRFYSYGDAMLIR